MRNLDIEGGRRFELEELKLDFEFDFREVCRPMEDGSFA